MDMTIPFHRESCTGQEAHHVATAATKGLSRRDYATRCEEWIRQTIKSPLVIMTSSATTALEMALLSLSLVPGEEVVLPSFAYPSAANAILLAGGRPVFAEIDPFTMELSYESLKHCVTSRTRAVVLVHYGGTSHNIVPISRFCKEQEITLIEDASHAFLAKHQDRYLGTYGDFGIFSFHYTKNISAGTGGAFLCNLKPDDPRSIRSSMIAENGTDRSLFLAGKTTCYQWQRSGLNVQPSELAMAYLWAQLEASHHLTSSREIAYRQYQDFFQSISAEHPVIFCWSKETSQGNYHTFFLRTRTSEQRQRLKQSLSRRGIEAVSHFEPLHSSPMGIALGWVPEDLPVTILAAGTLLRLPLYAQMTREEADYVVRGVSEILEEMIL